MCEIGFLFALMFMMEEFVIIIIYYFRLQKTHKIYVRRLIVKLFSFPSVTIAAIKAQYKSIFCTQTLLTVIISRVISGK